MALCRFMLSDEDLEALKSKCEDEKVVLSDLLRDCVADFLGYSVGINGTKSNHGRMASHPLDGQPAIHNDGQPAIYWMASHDIDEANTAMAMLLSEEGYFL